LVETNLEFPHSYEIEEVPEFPGTGKCSVPVFYFPRNESRPEHDGVWLRMRPANGESWVGVFDFGYQSPPAISKVISTFDVDRVCVISSGAAYIVKADDPETWEKLDVTPVLDVRVSLEHQLLVFADFTRLTAYCGGQLVWQSPRLCWDDLRILNVSQERIEGVGYDPTTSGDSCFAVDIRTGSSLNPSPVSIDGHPVW
jgi:hypothetical protein